MPNEFTQVLVIGGGLAGFCAALSAAEAGADVTLIEKTSKYGGSTVLSAGGFAFAGTDIQEAAGIQDFAELLRADLIKVGKDKNDPVPVDAFVERQLETYYWLVRHGVKFGPVGVGSSMAVPRGYAVNPQVMMDTLRSKIEESGRVTYWNECAATRILPADSPEKPLTVAVRANGRAFDISISAGVVIASGGFSRNAMLIERYAPHLRQALRSGGAGNTGDGYLMGVALGADHRDVAYLKGTFGVSVNSYFTTKPKTDEPMFMFSVFDGSIIVNLDAKRFVNESISYKMIGEACLRQRDAMAFQIFDAGIMAKSLPVPAAADYRLAEERGLLFRADTLTGLAEQLRIDPATFEETVSRYNNAVRDGGTDTEFGRKALAGIYGQLVTISAPPYYAFPCATSVLATYCGLAVDRSMQIINPYGEPVPRVFAAGEVVGGLHGEDYMSGSSLSKAAVFGRIAGANAAKLARPKQARQ